MLHNKEELYNNAIQCLCGNLDIPTALLDCYNLLKKHIPITDMRLGRSTFDETLTFVASNTKTPYVRYKNTPKLKEIAKIFQGNKLENGLTITESDDEAMSFLKIVNEESSNLIETLSPPAFFFRIWANNNIVGGVIFYYNEDNPLTEEHKEFLLTLRTPLLLMMNNITQYLDLQLYNVNLQDENRILKEQLYIVKNEDVIGKNKGLKEIFKKIEVSAVLDINIHITGETGTGKDKIAQIIHKQSNRVNKPFIAVNCGSIPPSLIDSELFGHVKGAFTGASAKKKGYFERAHTGTLFLDEIGELPLDMQPRLLRVLQDGVITPIGGEKELHLDFRLISATNNDLLKKVEEGLFREDLYFRLCEYKILLPPLRERKEDISDLINHFISYYTELFHLEKVVVSNNEIQKLLNYQYPGNIRELESIIKFSLASAKNNEFIAQIPEDHIELSNRIEKKNITKIDNPADKQYTTNLILNKNCNITFNEMQKEYFTKLLTQVDGKISGKGSASELAQIEPTTLRSKLHKLGIKFRKNEIN